MDKTLQILVIGTDSALPAEFESALAGTKVQAVVHHAPDFRRGVELARSRQPDLVLAPLARDVSALRNFTEELSAFTPDTSVAAIFRKESLPPDVSEGAVLIEAMRSGVQDFLRRPLSSADLKGLLDRLGRRGAKAPAKVGTVVSFVSNKGGVGKSTLAVNVATEIASRHPDRVLLIDASLQVGHCAAMLDVTPDTTLHDAIREWNRLDETLLRQLSVQHSSGLRLLAAPKDAFDASEVSPDAISRIVSLARRAFDYVIVDTFPLMDGVVLSVLDMSDRVLVVFHPTVPTVLGIAQFLKMLDRVGVPAERQALVLNHNHPTVLGGLRTADIEGRLARAIDYEIPFDKKVILAANAGSPFILDASRWFGAGKHVRQLATSIEAVRPADRSRDARSNGGATEAAPATAVDSGSPGPMEEVGSESPDAEEAVS